MKDFLLPLTTDKLKIGGIGTVTELPDGALRVKLHCSAVIYTVERTSVNSYRLRVNGDYLRKAYGSLRGVKMAVVERHRKATQISFDCEKLPKIKAGEG